MGAGVAGRGVAVAIAVAVAVLVGAAVAVPVAVAIGAGVEGLGVLATPDGVLVLVRESQPTLRMTLPAATRSYSGSESRRVQRAAHEAPDSRAVVNDASAGEGPLGVVGVSVDPLHALASSATTAAARARLMPDARTSNRTCRQPAGARSNPGTCARASRIATRH